MTDYDLEELRRRHAWPSEAWRELRSESERLAGAWRALDEEQQRVWKQERAARKRTALLYGWTLALAVWTLGLALVVGWVLWVCGTTLPR